MMQEQACRKTSNITQMLHPAACPEKGKKDGWNKTQINSSVKEYEIKNK